MLSVIVPVYNTEKYLRECLDSILKQDYRNLEILCMDDGSTDGSPEILDGYAGADPRLSVIHKKNSGYGDTVNTGIQAAKGEYIGIVESDDYAAEGALSKLMRLAREADAVVVKGNYFLFAQGMEPVLQNNLREIPKDRLLDAESIRKLFFAAPSIWSAVYKKSFLTEKDIWFIPSPGASYQDTAFAFKVWANAERVVATDDGVIYYRTDNQASSSNESNKVFEICAEFEEIEKHLRELNREDLWPVFARVKYISYFWNLNRLVPQKKVQFLDGVYNEFALFAEKGWLNSEIWPESDKAVVLRVLGNFDRYKADLLQGKAFYEAGV